MTAPNVRRLTTDDLTAAEMLEIRTLLGQAFESGEGGQFSDDDWDHALGGIHIVLDLESDIVAHAAVVERGIQIGGRDLRTGYVEAVAVAPSHQGVGHGSLLMTDVATYIDDRFDLGVLSTGRPSFYERLGWRIWTGPSFVRAAAGLHRTQDDDGDILVLPTRSSPSLDLAASISCDWRSGDVW